MELAAPVGSGIGSSSTRLPVLDGLRSWVILVMLAHFGNFDHPAPGDWLQRGWLLIAQVAFVGLDVFFVLSGFLITRILLDSKGSPAYFRTFYARRALRIFPVYYGFLIVYFLILPHVVDWNPAEVSITRLQHALYWTQLQNWSVLGPWGPSMEGTLVFSVLHFWSLGVEEQFYFIWPGVVSWCNTRVLGRICVACLIASPLIRAALVATLGVSPGAAYTLTPARLDGLALGALIAIAARQHDLTGFARIAKRVGPAAALVLLAIVAPQDVHDLESSMFQIVGLTASVYAAGSIVVLALLLRQNSLWYRTLSSLPFRRVGEYSFSAYVLHVPLAHVLNRTGIIERAWFRETFESNLGAQLGYAGTLIALSLALAALSWRFYEGPILKLRKYLPYARQDAPQPRVSEPET